MKTKTFVFLSLLVGLLALKPLAAMAQEYEIQNKYVQDNEKRKGYGIITGYTEYADPAYPSPTLAQNDKHIQIIGWDPAVPLKRMIGTIQEGVTDQLAILKLLSAPNVMGRNPYNDKETWVYKWLWSYKKEADPNTTIIMMNHPGKRIVKNKTPVTMVITFNDKDVVDSYVIKLLKIKRDHFYDY